MSTYLELKRQAEELLAQAEKLRVSERAAVIKEIQDKIAAYELSTRDLGLEDMAAASPPVKRARRNSSGAKFKGPNGEQWSGRGRQPRWLVAALAGGKDVSEFRV